MLNGGGVVVKGKTRRVLQPFPFTVDFYSKRRAVNEAFRAGLLNRQGKDEEGVRMRIKRIDNIYMQISYRTAIPAKYRCCNCVCYSYSYSTSTTQWNIIQ